MLNLFGNKDINSSKSKLWQDICGYVFILMFTVQFVFQILIVLNVISVHDYWYAFVIGVLSVCGFSILSKQASTVTADMFAISLLGLEFFFMVGRTFIMSLSHESALYFSVIYYISIFFCYVAVFMWSAILTGGKLRKKDIPWIMVLPLPFIVTIISYSGYMTLLNDTNSLANIVLGTKGAINVMRLVLCPFLAIGYWKLSHSDCFNGESDFSLEGAYLSPFNKYMLLYTIIIVIFVTPFSLFRPILSLF